MACASAPASIEIKFLGCNSCGFSRFSSSTPTTAASPATSSAASFGNCHSASATGVRIAAIFERDGVGTPARATARPKCAGPFPSSIGPPRHLRRGDARHLEALGQGKAKFVRRPVQHRHRFRHVQPLIGRGDFVDQHGMRDDDAFFPQLVIVQRQHQAVLAAPRQQIERRGRLLVDVAANDRRAALDFDVARHGQFDRVAGGVGI